MDITLPWVAKRRQMAEEKYKEKDIEQLEYMLNQRSEGDAPQIMDVYKMEAERYKFYIGLYQSDTKDFVKINMYIFIGWGICLLREDYLFLFPLLCIIGLLFSFWASYESKVVRVMSRSSLNIMIWLENACPDAIPAKIEDVFWGLFNIGIEKEGIANPRRIDHELIGIIFYFTSLSLYFWMFIIDKYI